MDGVFILSTIYTAIVYLDPKLLWYLEIDISIDF